MIYERKISNNKGIENLNSILIIFSFIFVRNFSQSPNCYLSFFVFRIENCFSVLYKRTILPFDEKYARFR